MSEEKKTASKYIHASSLICTTMVVIYFKYFSQVNMAKFVKTVKIHGPSSHLTL